jgi:hypothetical protein
MAYYILGPHGKLVQIPVPGPIAEARAETEDAIEGESIIEETLPAKETPNPLGSSKGFSDKEYRLGKLAIIDGSAAGDKTISDSEFFKDAVSCQSSDNDLLYIDRRKATRNR